MTRKQNKKQVLARLVGVNQILHVSPCIFKDDEQFLEVFLRWLQYVKDLLRDIHSECYEEKEARDKTTEKDLDDVGVRQLTQNPNLSQQPLRFHGTVEDLADSLDCNEPACVFVGG